MKLEDFYRSEYEIQHFNFSVDQVKLEHRLNVQKQVKILVKRLAESLIKKSNISNETAEKLRENSKDVTGKIISTIDDELNKFENLLEKHFSIPDNVLLAEDLQHVNMYTRDDEELFSEQATKLQEEFKQNEFLIASMNKELEIYEKVRSSLEVGEKVIEKVEHCFNNNPSLNELNVFMKKVDNVGRLKAEREMQ